MTLAERVQKALRDHVAPGLELDGRELEVLEVTNGIASVKLSGVCASCPATIPAMLMQMEAELKKHVPEVEIIEVVG